MKDKDAKRLASFPELNPNPILEVDSAGKITYINQAAKRRFPDLTRLELKHPLLTDLKSIFIKLKRGKAGSLAREVKVNSSVYYQAMHYVAKDEVVRIYNHDITAEKWAEEALRHALKESERRSAEISALLQATSQVLKYQKFEDSARSMFDSCKNLIGATAGYVALLSEEGPENEVLFLDSGGLPCIVDPSLPMPIRGLRAEAYKTGKAVYENDFAGSKWPKYMPPGHVSLDNVLFAPLNIEGKTVGLLGLANKQSSFTDADARTASAFGELVSLALQNSRLLESLKKSEETLAQERDTLNVIMENTPAHLAYLDRDFNFMLVNSTYAHGSGHTKDELIGRNHFELFPNEENQAIFGRVRDSGEPIEFRAKPFEFVDQPWRGVTYWDWTLTPIKDASGHVKGLVLSLVDVTENKRAEQRIKFQADILAQVSDAVIAVDNDDRVTYWNKAAEELYSLKSEEMLSRKLEKSHRWRWLKPEDEKTAHESLTKTGSWHGENIHVKNDGDEIHVESSVTVMKDESGNVLGRLAVIRDITERKWTENEIKRLNKVLERHIIERTAQLDSANKELERQIARRKWTEEELKKSLNKIREILGSPINPTS
ncbi:MAG: PAS domain S-box protein [Actinomycetota bacterium]